MDKNDEKLLVDLAELVETCSRGLRDAVETLSYLEKLILLSLSALEQVKMVHQYMSACEAGDNNTLLELGKRLLNSSPDIEETIAKLNERLSLSEVKGTSDQSAEE